MTTCPRCGRVADEEIVCAGCGRSLALVRRAAPTPDTPTALIPALGVEGDEATDARDPRVWRLAALVTLCCLIVLAAAILVLHQDGGGGAGAGKNAAFSPPATSGSSGDSVSGTVGSSSLGAGRPIGAPSSAAPSSTAPAASRTATHSASPSSSAATRSSGPRTSPAAAIRSVQVAKGAPDGSCGPHCYRVVVTLSTFGAGTHQIACWSGRGGQFGSYTTSAATSESCAYRRPHDSVWVVVDAKVRSNTIAW